MSNTKTPAPLFVVVDSKDKVGFQQALATATANYKSLDMGRTKASANTYRNIDSPNISVRDGFNRFDYDYFRPGERLPTEVKGVQNACRQAYRKFGIVRNMIDMMTDFIVKDINIVHKSPKVQEFGRLWFKKVAGKAVSNKIVRRLLREGCAPVRRKIQKITDPSITSLTKAGNNVKSILGPNEIPLSYKVLNPSMMEVIGGELAQFVSEDLVQYGISVPNHLVRKIQNPQNQAERDIVKSLRPDIFKAAVNGEHIIPLSAERLAVLHYKKDDDELWSVPMLNAILDDLQMLEKLRMADRSALDGAISHVRLWKMGSLDHEIIPTAEGIQTLADILLRSTGGGCMDLVWGPDLELQETGTDMFNFLGNEKYLTVMTSIYQGLGVPPSLTGAVSDTGLTNNFVSLRVLVERLDYCRDILSDFWINELEIVRSVFGFRSPFSLSYGIPSLSDDSAEKKILVELIDRDVISGIFVQERFGADPGIEQARLRQETRKRETGMLPPKAGQFHIDSQQKQQLERTFVASGEVTPSEVGLNLKPRKAGEIPSAEKQAQRKITELKSRPQPKMMGRPNGAKDNAKRKQKNATPSQKAKAGITTSVLWANAAYKSIDDVLRDDLLKMKKKANLRQLTDEEVAQYEDLKFSILCAHEIGSEVTSKSVRENLRKTGTHFSSAKEFAKKAIERLQDDNKEKPTIDQIRHIRMMAYAMVVCADESV